MFSFGPKGDFFYGMIASTVEILKFQETPKQFIESFDTYLLNTTTSGWDFCKEYAASLWIKKVIWIDDYETYGRLSSDLSE